ncbi:hypothetical protein SAMN04488121_10232 [Chitinophaga filiformis]|uniref:Uncharacterized protein n=1 Tax=Chitinophaga filiformis TaxID=104663 RepID=A0A1G7LE94_CHIFI|nr:hypothetical protein SAMN04488121_10232 [Chitinophaga filiformis]
MDQQLTIDWRLFQGVNPPWLQTHGTFGADGSE